VGPISLLGNLLWLFLGPGIICFFFWVIAGLIMAVTVVGLPFSIACFRIAEFAALPFGRILVDAEAVGEEKIFGTALYSVFWMVLAGVWLTLFHVLVGFLYFITIIGIPFALAHFKLALVSFNPLGKRIAYPQ
jgi:uncharacterized membrane protein YccF (DUF307 family)